MGQLTMSFIWQSDSFKELETAVITLKGGRSFATCFTCQGQTQILWVFLSKLPEQNLDPNFTN